VTAGITSTVATTKGRPGASLFTPGIVRSIGIRLIVMNGDVTKAAAKAAVVRAVQSITQPAITPVTIAASSAGIANSHWFPSSRPRGAMR